MRAEVCLFTCLEAVFERAESVVARSAIDRQMTNAIVCCKIAVQFLFGQAALGFLNPKF